MSELAKLSVVLPVRDGQDRIANEVRRVLDAVSDLTTAAVEIVVVDDGSRDDTVEVLDDLRREYPQVRVARHRRPLGMEAAGQTGLERATGELIFIQEEDQPLCLEDLMNLYRMGMDESVVAARAQSQTREDNGPLLRRLRAWGIRAADDLQLNGQPASKTVFQPTIHGLQMVRRPHLQKLASRGAENIPLESERIRTQRDSEEAPRIAPAPVGGDRDAWFAESMRTS